MKRAIPFLAALLWTAPGRAAVSRDEALLRARAFAEHPWHASSSNQTATCSAAYRSLYAPGDYVGLAYDWGGYMTLFEFDKQIADGFGAGSQEPDGVLDCTAGLDCSGFVSQVWKVGHFTTSSLHQTSSSIAEPHMLPGDVYNKANYHVAMLTHRLANGEPALVEAIGYNVHKNLTGGFSHVSGYTPRRLNGISPALGAGTQGTLADPFVIGSFPYVDSRSTQHSLSDVIDGCGAAPSKPERGPEYVYAVEISQPGALTVSVTDDATADIDVSLLDSKNTYACLARADATFTVNVGCGTYYVVADTYGQDATKAGNYSLSVNLVPSGQSCGATPGPRSFDPNGELGEPCAFPQDQSLPFCNENLGATTCLYGATSSFCTKACTNDADCGAMPGGGCCRDISGQGELYCMAEPMCENVVRDGGGDVLTPKSDGGTLDVSAPGSDGAVAEEPAEVPPNPDEEEAVKQEAAKTDTSPASGRGGCTVSETTGVPWPCLLALLSLRRRRAR